jgi:hypothetical protein
VIPQPALDRTTIYERCETCHPHAWHGRPCTGWECPCRGPFADVPDAWLPVKPDLEEKTA